MDSAMASFLDYLEREYMASIFTGVKVLTLTAEVTPEEEEIIKREFPLIEIKQDKKKRKVTFYLAPRKGTLRPYKKLASFIWTYLFEELPIDLRDNISVERVADLNECKISVFFYSRKGDFYIMDVLSKHKMSIHITAESEDDVRVKVEGRVGLLPEFKIAEHTTLPKALRGIVDYFHQHSETLEGLIENKGAV